MINFQSFGEENRALGLQDTLGARDFFEPDGGRYISSTNRSPNTFHQSPYTLPLSSNTFGRVVIEAPSEPSSGTAIVYYLWGSNNDKSNWAAKTILLISQHKQYEALDIISAATTEAKSKREFGKLAEELKLFDLDQLPDLLIIALLRNTFSMRQYIDSWPDMLRRAERTLRSRKRDPKTLLRGLRRKV